MRLRAAALALVVAACGTADPDPAAGKSCDGLLGPADPAAALPAGIPNPDGATVMSVEVQGATRRYLGRLPGTDLVVTRDRFRDAFQEAGFTIEGTDQEAGAEADLFFTKGEQEGSVQVAPLCDGHLRIRWRLG